jgi:hypothetical protein
MNISNLKPGTKLIWDPNENYPGTDVPIIYPALVGQKHIKRPWVLIHTNAASSWMGWEQEYLRLPTKEELETLKWPEL